MGVRDRHGCLEKIGLDGMAGWEIKVYRQNSEYQMVSRLDKNIHDVRVKTSK